MMLFLSVVATIILIAFVLCCCKVSGEDAECLEEKNCDQDLAKDVLDLIGRRDEEKEKAS